ncbi:hypothetical protein R80B4_00350 [Fibrobacteres bacterium R8-0-B4]
MNQIYFGVLLFDAQLEQNKLFREELLGSNYDRVSSCVQNGTALKADLDAVKAERLSINSVTARRDAFLFNVHIDISGKQRDIDKYGELIKYDDDIIVLRKSVRESSEVKIANGTLSGVDLMRDVFAEESAKQAKIVHEIEWLLNAQFEICG